MPDRIRLEDILDPAIKKAFIDHYNDIDKIIAKYKELLAVSKQLHTELNKGATTNEKLAKTAKEVGDNQKKLSDVEKEIIKIEDKHYQTITKMMAERSKENKLLQEVALKRKQENQQLKENIQISKASILTKTALTGTYKQIEQALNANILKYKSLTQAERDNKAVGGELIKTIQRQDAELKKLDANIGKFGRNVGNYSSAFKGLGNSLKSLSVAFGVTGGLFMFANLLKDGFTKIKDFDKAMSGLQSVANATDKEMRQLSKSALYLGAITPRTASEVAGLQTEFAKLGFTTREILAATEATINLSIATGSDLANAASIAGSTLRGFQLDATEMNRVIDVMTRGFSTSALDISNFSEAIKYVAPVAKAAGFSIEEVTAMLGKLADAGIRGSMAGTGLRRIFLEVSKSGKPAKEALDDLARSGISLAEANDEVGDRAQTALLILSNQKKEVERLTGVYENAAGSAQKMADIMADNLAGDMDKAKSAWEGFILGLDSGDGIITKISRGLVQLWTDIINIIAGANKSRQEMVDTAKEFSLQETLRGDIKELDNYGQLFISQIEVSKEALKTKVDLLQAERLELLKNKATNEKLNENAKLLSYYNGQIAVQDERIVAGKQYLIDKEITLKKAKDELTAATKAQREQEGKQIQENIKGIEKEGEVNMKFMEDWERDVKNQAKIQEEMNAEITKNKQDTLKSEEEADKRTWERKKERLEEERRLNEELNQVKLQITQAGFDLFSALNDREVSDLEERRDYEIEMAGNNARTKERIEKEYASKIAQIKTKQAVSEKLFGLFRVGVDTASAIMKNTAQLGYVPAIPINILTGILGGLQAATILATPIPKFFKGVKGFEGGEAMVGERGWELGRTKDNDFFITPDIATRMILPKGTDIYTHQESERKIKEIVPSIDIDKLVQEQQKTRKAIANRPEHHTHIDQFGMRYMIKKNSTTITFLDKYIRG